MVDLERLFKITDGNNEFCFKVKAPSASDLFRILDFRNGDEPTYKIMKLMMNYVWIMAGDKELEQMTIEKVDSLFTNKKNILVFEQEVARYVFDFFV